MTSVPGTRAPRRDDRLAASLLIGLFAAVLATVELGVLAILLTGPYTPLLPLALPIGILIGILCGIRWHRKGEREK